MPFNFNGVTYNIPAAYGLLQVITSGGGTLPDFNVGLIIGKSMKGAPYTSSTKGEEIMLPYSDAGALAKDYGYDDIYTVFKEAQRPTGNLPAIFVLNAQPNTEAKATLVDSASADSLVAKAAPKNWGMFGNDIQLGVSNSASEVLCSASSLTNFTGSATGTATGTSTTTLTMTGAGWTSSNLIGSWIVLTGGTGAGQSRKITANTATAVTVATWTVTPDTTTTFKLVVPKWAVTVIATKNEKIITQDVSSGQNFFYLNNTIGLGVGSLINIMNNPTGAIGTYEVLSIDTNFTASANGYKVVLTSSIASSGVTGANYARVCQFATDSQTVVYFENSEYTVDGILTALNAAQSEVIFSKASGATLPPNITGGNQYLGQIASATKGLNPAISTNDYTVIADNFPNWKPSFLRTNKVNIRLIHLTTSDSSVHGVFNTLAGTMANNENKAPLVVITGNASSESVTTITARSQSLNTDRVWLCGGSVNGKAPYLSLSAQIFGITSSFPVTHNITRDQLAIDKVEYEWTPEQLKTLNKNGVLTYQSTKTGYRVVQGVTTYQNQSTIWNQQDNKTYLCAQRQLADYYYIGVLEYIDENLIGTDNVTEQTVTNALVARSQKYLDEGYITGFRIVQVKKVQGGWLPKIEVLLPEQTDYIGIVVNVISIS